jgi:hypothetical protein
MIQACMSIYFQHVDCLIYFMLRLADVGEWKKSQEKDWTRMEVHMTWEILDQAPWASGIQTQPIHSSHQIWYNL